MGAGISGFGAAKLAWKHDFEVFVSEFGVLSEEAKTFCEEKFIDYEEGGHTLDKILNADEIIKSPGIDPKSSLIKDILERGIPVIDELEFAGRYTKAKKILVTGTNGKTTTTLLINHLLQSGGINSVAVGNVGNSFAGELYEQDHDVFVIESSSFQLDGMVDFRAHSGVLLNITEDHLNRYGSFVNYIESKHQLEELIHPNGLFIYNKDNISTHPYYHVSNVKAVSVTGKKAEAMLIGNQMIIEDNDKKFNIDVSEYPLKGSHNYFNALCAILIARDLGINREDIVKGLNTFTSVPHRLEKVAEINGITFINDSKATNVDAVRYALDSFDNPLVWIAGGVDKGNDYRLIMDMVKAHVKSLVCLGKDNQKLKNSFEEVIHQIWETTDMNEAVRLAFENGNKQDIVLLSPACASFDLFQNYEDRGNQFKNAVWKLKEEIA